MWKLILIVMVLIDGQPAQRQMEHNETFSTLLECQDAMRESLRVTENMPPHIEVKAVHYACIFDVRIQPDREA